MNRYLLAATLVLACSTDVRAQSFSCTHYGDYTSCTNGVTRQRYGTSDFYSVPTPAPVLPPLYLPPFPPALPPARDPWPERLRLPSIFDR